MALRVQNRKIFLKQEFYCPQAQPLLTATSAFKTEEDATDFLSDITYTICKTYAEYKNTVYKRQQYADRLNQHFCHYETVINYLLFTLSQVMQNCPKPYLL